MSNRGRRCEKCSPPRFSRSRSLVLSFHPFLLYIFSFFFLTSSLEPALAFGPVDPVSISRRDVTFETQLLASGRVRLQATLVFPSSLETSTVFGRSPGVVLIGGSGPSDRWESLISGGQVVTRTFFDVANSLAENGFVVLAYNKRSCTTLVDPLCASVTVCHDISPYPTSGCLSAAWVRFDDFVSDAFSALSFLVSETRDGPMVDSRQITLIGHSQGCTVASIVGSLIDQLLPQVRIANLVLLAGVGVPAGDIVVTQTRRQWERNAVLLSYIREHVPPSPDRDRTIAALLLEMTGQNCTMEIVPIQNTLLLEGKMPDVRDGFLSGGFVNSTSGEYVCPIYCPVTGEYLVCSTMVSRACLPYCQQAALAGSLSQAQFLLSWYNATTPEKRRSMWSNQNSRILSVNSWFDLKVVPNLYEPLHSRILNDLPGTTNEFAFGNPTQVQQVTVMMYPNLTHALTYYPPESTEIPIPVSSSLLSTLTSWCSSGVSFPSVSSTASSFDWRILGIATSTTSGVFLLALIWSLTCQFKIRRQLKVNGKGEHGREGEDPLLHGLME